MFGFGSKKNNVLPAASRMSPGALDAAFKGISPPLVNEFYALALRQNQNEDQREVRLDAKAQSLLATAGLSLTAASTFGGLMLQHPELVTPFKEWVGVLAVIIYAGGLVFGLLASVWALRALYVRADYEHVDENVAFDRKALETADDKDTDDKKRGAYQNYLASHHWQIWQNNTGIHKEKSALVRRGQVLFFVFLVSMLLVGLAAAAATVKELL